MKNKGIGCKNYQDDFDVNGETIKSKTFSIIAFDDNQLAVNFTLLDAQNRFSPHNLVPYFVCHEEHGHGRK
jgi:hypothetical protein